MTEMSHAEDRFRQPDGAAHGVGSGEIVRRQWAPGEHTVLLHASAIPVDEKPIEILYLPSGWTVTPLSLNPKGEWLEYRFKLTPPNTDCSRAK